MPPCVNDVQFLIGKQEGMFEGAFQVIEQKVNMGHFGCVYSYEVP